MPHAGKRCLDHEFISGLAAGHMIVLGANTVLMRVSGFTVPAAQVQPVEWLVLAGCVLLGTLAGFCPAVRAYRTEVAENLAPTN